MNKPLILLSVAAVLVAVWYFFLRGKPLTQQAAAGNGTLTPDNQAFLDSILKQNTGIAGPTSNDIIKAAQGVQVAGLVNKTIEQITGKTLGQIGNDVVSNIIGKETKDVASDLLKNATADVLKSAATPDVANMATKIATLPSVAGASTPAEAMAAADAATGGLSTLASVALGVAPIVLVVGIAAALGVFDKWDPHAEFQKFTLGFDVPELNLRKGDTIDWIPNAIYDQMNADPANAEMILRGFLSKQIAANEAKNAAVSQIQKLNDQQSITVVNSPLYDPTLSVDQKFIKDAQDPSTGWGNEIYNYLGANYTPSLAIQVANTHIGMNSGQYQQYTSAYNNAVQQNAMPNVEQIKQNIALKTYGNTSTQYN